MGETQPGLVSRKDAAKKLIDLGMAFTPVEDAIKESEESMRENGLLSKPSNNTN